MDDMNHLRCVVVIFLLCLSAPLFAQNNRMASAQAANGMGYYASEAPLDPSVSADLRLAAAYCQLRAFSTGEQKICWRRVKEALVKAGAVSSYPATRYAYQAGNELVTRYGFRKIDIRNPYDAPVGAILVYKDDGEVGGFGHAEIRTLHGFASDRVSRGYCKYKLTGVYIK
jgi:hypothetical protein